MASDGPRFGATGWYRTQVLQQTSKGAPMRPTQPGYPPPGLRPTEPAGPPPPKKMPATVPAAKPTAVKVPYYGTAYKALIL